jgi:hypothetical protein
MNWKLSQKSFAFAAANLVLTFEFLGGDCSSFNHKVIQKVSQSTTKVNFAYIIFLR